MFNKKKIKEENINKYYDEKYTEYVSLFKTAQQNLRDSAENVLTKKLAVEIYPEGADKEQAKQDLEKAQHSLICHIGAMDARRQEMLEYYTKWYEELKPFNWRSPYDYGTSHETIECVVTNFYRR